MLVLLTGPTGSGKTSLALAAARHFSWPVIATLTTRSIRPGQNDTKHHADRQSIQRLAGDPSHYRLFHYEGHLYATPLEACRRAAIDPAVTTIIDWVHPHPEDLGFLGGRLVAVVLLPSTDALRHRSHEAGRGHRLENALRERESIVAQRGRYKPPWTLLESDASTQDLVLWLGRAVNQLT